MPIVKTAVAPAAGIGTRMFPISLSSPKELLPILGLPAIHLTALEAKMAGIERFVIVISRGKEQLLDYFKPHPEIEAKLKAAKQTELLEAILEPQKMFDEVEVVYQDNPHGLGHAVLCARDIVGDEPFAVLLPDDIFYCDPPCLKQLIDALGDEGGAIAIKEVPKEEVHRYGICGGEKLSDTVLKLDKLVEKPKPEDAPGNHAIMGRYILPPETFRYLSETRPGAIGEIQLTDALQRVATESEMRGVIYDGVRYDAGTIDGYIKTQLTLASLDDKYKSFMKTLLT